MAPKDGTVLATVSRGMATEPLLNDAKFDATKLTWVGSITSETSVCATWHTSPVKTWDDMFAREFTLGGSATGADPDTFALILRNVFGAKVKLVTGYPGGNDINLAMERGEVDGRCGWSWTSIKSQKQPGCRKISLLAQFALEQHADLPEVPMALERAANDEQRQVLRLLIAGQFVGRPFFGPPDLPAERKAALRRRSMRPCKIRSSWRRRPSSTSRSARSPRPRSTRSSPTSTARPRRRSARRCRRSRSEAAFVGWVERKRNPSRDRRYGGAIDDPSDIGRADARQRRRRNSER